jgi:hypothetical protein
VSSSDTIAVGAAIISTLSAIVSLFALFISWLAYQRDNGKLKLSCVTEQSQDVFHLDISITNVGRRPVTLKNITYYKRVKWFLFLWKNEISDSDTIATWTNDPRNVFGSSLEPCYS